MPTYNVPESVHGSIATPDGEHNFRFAEGEHEVSEGTKGELALEHLVSVGKAKRVRKTEPEPEPEKSTAKKASSKGETDK